MQAKTEANFSSSRRLDNGQVQLAYTETIDARAGSGQIEIPREFSIGVRLFKNGTGYKLRARLKYRLGAGKVRFWYELDRPQQAIDNAARALDSARFVLATSTNKHARASAAAFLAAYSEECGS